MDQELPHACTHLTCKLQGCFLHLIDALHRTFWPWIGRTWKMRARRLFSVIGLLVASVFPPISLLLLWNAVPAVSLSLSRPPRIDELCCNDMSEALSYADQCIPARLPPAAVECCTRCETLSLSLSDTRKIVVHMSLLRNPR